MENSSFHLGLENPLYESLNLSQISNRPKKACDTARVYSSFPLDSMARESSRHLTMFSNAPETRKENRATREQHAKDKPANLRGFLRHTTYVNKASSFFEEPALIQD